MRKLIALRNGYVEIPVSNMKVHDLYHEQVVMSTQAELMKLGYALSHEAYDALRSESNTTDVIKFHDSVIAYLRKMLGADRKYRPFYAGFPQEVMEKSSVELLLNALLHYWSGGTWEPSADLRDRGIKFEHTSFKLLKRVSGDDWLRQLAAELAGFTKPLDDQRVEDLIWIAKNVPNVEVPYISVKETLCALGAAGIEVKVTSPVDVLRIATKLSGGDISLPGLPKPEKINDSGWRGRTRKTEAIALRETFKFKKFTRSQRKYLLGMLESLKTIDVSEMARHLGRWLRLGEILHPGEYEKKFPKAFAAFAQLRNQDNVKVRTFAGAVDLAFMKSPEAGFNLLKTRPGELARRLDSLLRHYDTDAIPHFEEIVDKVSSKVIFEMHDHFEGRRKSSPRSVMLKGRGSKMQVLADLPELPASTVNEVQRTILNSLTRRFSALPKLGNVYLDEELKNVPVPFSMQSSSEGVCTYARGTRVKFNNETKVLRGFVHWFDPEGSIDVDLAAGFYDHQFNLVGEIAYYNLKNNQFGACHSGDVRHRVGDCAEYIDVTVERSSREGVRYVIFTAYNFNGNSISSVPNCTFGVMEREHAQNNEIFDAKTVTNAVKLQAKSNSCMPVAFDLERKQWIWMDLEHDQRGYANHAKDSSSKKQFEAILGGSRLSIYDLLLLHVEGRDGNLVSTPEEADEVFLESDFRTSYSKLTPFLAV